MKNLIAFLFPLFSTLAGTISVMKSQTLNDWLAALIPAIAAGLGGLIGKTTNKAIDSKGDA